MVVFPFVDGGWTWNINTYIIHVHVYIYSTYLYVLFKHDVHYIYNTFSLKFQSLIQSEYPRPIKYSTPPMNHTKYPPVKLTWQWKNTMSNKRMTSSNNSFSLATLLYQLTRLYQQLSHELCNKFCTSQSTGGPPKQSGPLGQGEVCFNGPTQYLPCSWCAKRFFWQNSQRPNWMNLEKSWFLGNKESTNTMVY